jgi:hypothetical protein
MDVSLYRYIEIKNLIIWNKVKMFFLIIEEILSILNRLVVNFEVLGFTA